MTMASRMGEQMTEAHSCRHRCRTCGIEVIATARSHAEALEECSLCEQRRYNAERVWLRCGNCEQVLDRAETFAVSVFGGALYHQPGTSTLPCGPVGEA
jgi:hypothetical protein